MPDDTLNPLGPGVATAAGPAISQADAAIAVDPAPSPAGADAINQVVDLDAGGSWGAETVTLKHPFKLKGVVYQAISLRVPTGLDLTRFYADKNRGLVQVAIGLCTANGAAIDNVIFGAMVAEDAQAIVSKTSNFLFGPQEISKTS